MKQNYYYYSLFLVGILLCCVACKETQTTDNRVIEKKETGSHEEAKELGKIKPLSFDKQTLPDEIKYLGDIQYGAKWIDKTGENLLLLSQKEGKTKPVKSDTPTPLTYNLYGYLFNLKGGTFQKVWSFEDSVKDCNLDITCQFLSNSLTITDLDSNEIAEVAFLYRKACRGDISPTEQTLLMYEGGRKYITRGTALILREIEGKKEQIGGARRNDEGLKFAHPKFEKFVNDRWRVYQEEKME
ncbi:MAG: M949_RS01915 family surface polysaccharide biosynthesis protein [Bacteroidia bacterium]